MTDKNKQPADGEKPAPLKPATMGQLIQRIFAGQIEVRDGARGIARELERLVDRSSDEIDQERRSQEREIERKDGLIDHLRQENKMLRDMNARLRGRMETLEQVAKIEPLNLDSPPPSLDPFIRRGGPF